MNFAANEISKGKNLEMNLPRFGIALINTFNNYSFVRLSMNYYTYYEMVSESANNNDKLKELVKSVDSHAYIIISEIADAYAINNTKEEA